MSIHKAPSGKWVVRFRSEGRNRGKSFTQKDDAIRFEADVTRRMELGERILSRRDIPTVREEALTWLASKQGLAPSTEAAYARLLERLILPALGEAKISELRPRRLEDWQGNLIRNGSGSRAVQQARMVLYQILSRAVVHEYISANPLQFVPGPKHETKTREPATVEQVEALRNYFLERDLRRDAMLISVLGYTGLRPPQESHAVMWSDIEDRYFHLRRRNVYGEIQAGLKTGKRARMVEIPGPVALELAEYRLSIGRPTGLIFPTSDYQPLSKSDWGNWRRRHFDKAKAAVDLPAGFVPYDLRHTCASLMIASGRTSPEVAEQLGHGLTQSINTYQHLIHSMRGKEVIPLEERILRARSLDVHSDAG